MVTYITKGKSLREMVPGMLSRELEEALGMPDSAPPPWLVNILGALCMEMLLEYYSRMNLIMMKILLTTASTGETWRKKRRKRRRKNGWKRKWKKACSLLTPFQALQLAWKHLMLLTSGSCRGRSLRGRQKSSYTRFLSRKKKESHLELYMDQVIHVYAQYTRQQRPRGLICLKIRSLIKWMSPYNPRSWKLWMMFWQPSTKKHERRRSFETKRKISVTWWQRIQTRGRESKRRKGNRRRISSSKSWVFGDDHVMGNKYSHLLV